MVEWRYDKQCKMSANLHLVTVEMQCKLKKTEKN